MRADELIRIAEGRTTVEAARADTAKRMQKSRKQKSVLRNTDSSASPRGPGRPPRSRRCGKASRAWHSAVRHPWTARWGVGVTDEQLGLNTFVTWVQDGWRRFRSILLPAFFHSFQDFQ